MNPSANVDPKILGKIKKCLALSASSNENEAATALRQAQKLMAEYGVTEATLVGAEVGTAKAQSTACKNPAGWESMLCNTLSKAFACEVILIPGKFNSRTGCNEKLAEFMYIGLQHQASTAAYAHDVLRRQIVKARVAYLAEWTARMACMTNFYRSFRLADKIAAGETFSRGFVSNVARQVSAVGGLAPQVLTAITDRKRQELGGEGEVGATTKRGYDAGAYVAGQAAGGNAQLHRGVDGSAGAAQIGVK